MRLRLVSILLIVSFVLSGLTFSVGVARSETPAVADEPVTPAATNPGGSTANLQSEMAMEALLRRTSVPERDLLDLAIRLKRAPADTPRQVQTKAVARAEGDQQVFWISDQPDHSYFKSTATLRAVTPHLYMWVENGYNVSDEALHRSAERFENHTYPLTCQFFGKEWTPGVDGDPHVSVFNGYVPGVGGYFSSADEVSSLVNRYSNQREQIYINLDNATPGSDYYDSILAHELQHMIHWNNDCNEQTWVNEGMAELSAQVNGFNSSGSPNAFVEYPDTQLTNWADVPGQAAPNYGASHSFMSYLLQRFGDGVIRSLVADKENGLIGLDDVLRSKRLGVTADEVFADWVVANYLGDPKVADGRFGYRLTQAAMKLDITHDTYPVERSTDVHQYAADYIELKGNSDLLVDFEGASQVKLTNNEPHSGQYQWWSNRGDDSDMTLSRAFDLTGLRAATLQFWLWYDIEKEWDYAFAEISTDGGHTWDTLKGQYTTDKDPNGNSYGWAYTGVSGGGDTPQWVQERIDLTPYAGKKVLLRFEYVTDDAVNHAGLCLDDLAIPELGYSDDAESDNGWVARGFVRSSNFLPQRFLLQIIEFGPQNRIWRPGSPNTATKSTLPLVLGPHQFAIRGLGRDVQRAVLVVSAIAPVTTEIAPYRYQITPTQGEVAKGG